MALVAVIALGGCEAAKSSNPTAPTVAGPIPGVAITAPKPLEPHAGQTLTFSSEPPTLMWICFHVLHEYARHAGHLDIACELADAEPG